MNEISSIQELENIDVSKYKDDPFALVGIAKNLQNFQKYEKAIEIFEQALKFVIAKNDNNEEALDCAKYYYHYGSAVLRKLMNNNELFQNEVENKKNKEDLKEQDSKETPIKEDKVNNINSNINSVSESKTVNEVETNTSDNQEDIKITNENNINEAKHTQTKDINGINNNIEKVKNEDKDGDDADDADEYDNTEIPEEVEVEDDEEIVFLNLSVAEKIFSKNLEKYEHTNDISEEVRKLIFDRTNNLLSLGELEMHKSDFPAAVDYFLQALEIRKKYDDKYSREIAEIYFLLAGAYDFDIKKSLVCYYKTMILMEHHLKLELNKLNFHKQESWEEKVDKINLDFEEINEKDIVLDKKLIQTSFGDNQTISELRDILAELFEKIEDATVDLNNYKESVKIFEEKQKGNESNEFNKNYDTTKVIDLSQTNLIKKRQRVELESDVTNNLGSTKQFKPENEKKEEKDVKK